MKFRRAILQSFFFDFCLIVYAKSSFHDHKSRALYPTGPRVTHSNSFLFLAFEVSAKLSQHPLGFCKGHGSVRELIKGGWKRELTEIDWMVLRIDG
jgi:hypothetical protein